MPNALDDAMDSLLKFLRMMNPAKSVFSLYLLMYVLPMFIPVMGAMAVHKHLISNDQLNVGVALFLGVCGIAGIAWTVWFLLYFTKQRNANPELYEKGFLSELEVRGG